MAQQKQWIETGQQRGWITADDKVVQPSDTTDHTAQCTIHTKWLDDFWMGDTDDWEWAGNLETHKVVLAFLASHGDENTVCRGSADAILEIIAELDGKEPSIVTYGRMYDLVHGLLYNEPSNSYDLLNFMEGM